MFQSWLFNTQISSSYVLELIYLPRKGGKGLIGGVGIPDHPSWWLIFDFKVSLADEMVLAPEKILNGRYWKSP